MQIRIPHRRVLPAALLLATLANSLVGQRGQIERRQYHFEEAGKDIEYALFVPTERQTPAEGKPAAKGQDELPLVVLLHGLGSSPRQVIRYRGITEEAEDRGYAVVAPFGYNERGWYGSRGKGKRGQLFGAAGDPDNLGELSEKDVLNVLEIVRNELPVDENRIYLMGHSMGGAGTIHLGSTYPHLWAALAPIAPAHDPGVEPLDPKQHQPNQQAGSEKDRLIQISLVRRWAAAMKEREMTHVYREIEGGDHVRAFASNPGLIGEIFDFFDLHRRQPQPAAEGEDQQGAPATPPRDEKPKTAEKKGDGQTP